MKRGKNILRFLARCGARGKDFYQVNEHLNEEQYYEIIKKVKDADLVVLFSDGGTPCVADPGYSFISLCYDFGIEVSSYPGPSSITAALSISGFFAERFYFAGFLPKDRKMYKKFAEKLDQIGETTVFFERPYGIKNIIDFLKSIKKRRVFIAFNIGTKDFFSLRGLSEEIAEKLCPLQNFKAPFVVVLEKTKI